MSRMGDAEKVTPRIGEAELQKHIGSGVGLLPHATMKQPTLK